MKTVTIRELHNQTGELVRQASRHGGIRVTHHGRIVARILPEAEPAPTPYFARRRYVSPKVKKLIESGRLGRGGVDSAIAISEDREDRV